MDMKISLNNLQKECDAIYELYGPTDDVIQLQAAINNLRFKFDIPDESNMTESNKGFVQ